MLRRTVTSLRNARELHRLLPALLPLLDPPVPTGASVCAAHLIVATGHVSKQREPHMSNCPVLERKIPLSEIASDDNFLKHPCVPCLKHRINFLASEDFCYDFVERCGCGTDGALPPEWRCIVERQFGSMAALVEELVIHASNRREAGWTWLVYDAQQAGERPLLVVNMPAQRSPLLLGLWPLAVVNVTEAVLVEAVRAESSGSVAAAPPPPWCRAARASLYDTKAAAEAFAMTAPMSEGVGKKLSEIREKVARDAVSRMNWGFILQQLKKAETYYASSDRGEKIRVHRMKLEREAVTKAMSGLRDSGATFLTHDTVEVTTTPSANSEPSSPERVPGVQAKQPQTEGMDPCKNKASAEPDPKCTQLPDGTWQYSYRNGDVTLLKPDGTRVFRKRELTTTAYPDGSMLFQYANNTSILDRADGVRVTTFEDGTTKEEMIRR
ncbi:hypothetical protein, conserved [Trypanosoma brucei gambiense DAL972]|uniref:Manganese/iron superoxide dismutase C-terminal domain-containing protein n=2 Tax=Trypanosoma brucei TaxID=5691 RepID=C9ZN11_TRYB9|nr:hypothetical protein, conserved [Trypanosoma brucei gambiense DAL972]6HIV_Cr Chain Cr, mS43 [Trypanosoma brucei brucei]6HIW_Cr Chain Cr, mS43 [Trypanosoma brucei brucei]6HIY_Cr Chain Cr, mS43 [Trypanosoma brucei brucei]7PUB_Cr Chain Cr, Sod_Fe_C domain-containing protein [Trypanosoma brucei brucei]RHW73196.1 Iron/manganese superoxide dismutase [Trypanosoma brucei equiperdum]CBH10665.1 hypothetical protein, conserved [Trypanosoma brucei gambiense DAL972]|eukprot:XP_011772953.1 hypothetical protein, conserved [Trypanosoma brucei gambiense DAL972]